LLHFLLILEFQKQLEKKNIMASMEGLIGLMNRIQRACTALGDHGGGGDLPTLWESLPTIAVVGGQVQLFLIFVLHSSPHLLGRFLSTAAQHACYNIDSVSFY
jgi:hypothetical protein